MNMMHSERFKAQLTEGLRMTVETADYMEDAEILDVINALDPRSAQTIFRITGLVIRSVRRIDEVPKL